MMKVIDANNLDLKQVNQLLREKVNGHPVVVTNVSHIHGMIAGFRNGEIHVQSRTGDYLGVLNDGATIRVSENTGKYVADNMTSGEIILEADAGYGAAQYCYGGTVVIHGNASDFTASMNKGATIIVAGDIGDEAGTYMFGGDLIVAGNAGDNFANYLIRGNVYIAGEWKSLGHNTELVPIQDDDMDMLQEKLAKYNIAVDLTAFKKIVAASTKPFYK
jgi:glutamate synthase domain-containing protein 3